MKHVLRKVARAHVPAAIVDRTDKMGFPVPLSDWVRGELREFVRDVFSSRPARERALVDNVRVLDGIDREPRYCKLWGLLGLELWQREFLDRASEIRAQAGVAP